MNNFLFIHNDYARPSGEEHASQNLARLLESRGHYVSWYRRSSAEITSSHMGHVKALFTALHNPAAVRSVRRSVQKFRPDIVQVQNVYPLISASIFPELRRLGVPVVMRCPNYRLLCPNGLHLCKGEVCERCLGPGRELNCVWHNCLDSPAKSVAYALRNWLARIRRRMLDHVDMFIVQSEFQKAKFSANGIPANRIAVVPGLLAHEEPNSTVLGKTVSFVGRVSPEKGIDEFLEAARLLPEIPFAIAGDATGFRRSREDVPPNVQWHGFLDGDNLDAFFRSSRILVFPSRWYEGFPNVTTRAMAMSKPVIASRIGVFPEIVEDGVSGLLFDVGNGQNLAAKIGKLYGDTNLCRQLGRAGRLKASTSYTSDVIYERLMDSYTRARRHADAAGGTR